MYEPTLIQTPTQAVPAEQPVVVPQAVPESTEGSVIVPQADGVYNFRRPMVDPSAFVISER